MERSRCVYNGPRATIEPVNRSIIAAHLNPCKSCITTGANDDVGLMGMRLRRPPGIWLPARIIWAGNHRLRIYKEIHHREKTSAQTEERSSHAQDRCRVHLKQDTSRGAGGAFALVCRAIHIRDECVACCMSRSSRGGLCAETLMPAATSSRLQGAQA